LRLCVFAVLLVPFNTIFAPDPDAVSLYRGMGRAALGAAYDNSAAVADSAALLAEFDDRSARLRAAKNRHLDLRYGPAERNRIDYFAADRPGPEKPLAGIADEVRAAIAWLAARVAGLGGDAARMYVCGWSAGGHLTAMCLNEPAVKGGLAISGIFELEPIRLCFLNDKLGLDALEAQRLSPLLHLPRVSAPLIVACGGGELPELQRQSEAFAAARARAGLPGKLLRLAGHNHFTILEELARADGVLTKALLELTAA
jgi:arylformamidase